MENGPVISKYEMFILKKCIFEALDEVEVQIQVL